MKKLTLDLDALRLESFHANAGFVAGGSTARGNEAELIALTRACTDVCTYTCP
jgi:hypothetical protein